MRVRAARLLLAAALAVPALAAAFGCGEPRSRPVPLEVEQLAFVPAASCQVELVVDCSTARDLVVGRFEVTRGEWLTVAEDRGELALPPAFASEWSEDTTAWPAAGMDLDQARAFAAARGMRLPTVAEWMRIAAGTRGQSWPWGTRLQDSAANTLELGLLRPAPVGTFENGQTHDGVHDLVGNVWEWAEPPLPIYSSIGGLWAVQPLSAASSGRGAGLPHWAMGGSYLSSVRARALHWTALEGVHFFAQDFDPRHRARDLGLRLVADAEGYLEARAAEWSRREYQPRLVLVGRRWGRAAVPLLERLSRREGAPPALAWLLAGARE